jgi:hypothetical protein
METSQPNDGLVGLRAIEKHPPIGVMPNEGHQDALGFMKANNFRLAIVEFDDQGRCYNRIQLDKVCDAIEQMRETSNDAIFLVFVHGWKRDARSNDDNLSSFRRVLDKTAQHERQCAESGKAREVFGIFVGWRGLSAYGLGAENLTFWDRQDAAHRVASGSARELFGRLRHYRNSRVELGGTALLVISGHSFGGMIVFWALAQSLIEAASDPAGGVVPRFADLVLLANPAMEGARYLPIYDLVTSKAFESDASEQLPVFVCAQAQNDQAVGRWFPIGNAANGVEEASIGPLEKRCITHGIGFIEKFRTHSISGPAGRDPFVLDPPDMIQKDPYWVVWASKDVINGHGGIWLDPFMCFLAAVLFQHVKQSALRTPAADPKVSLATALSVRRAKSPKRRERTLAEFARSISQGPFSARP